MCQQGLSMNRLQRSVTLGRAIQALTFVSALAIGVSILAQNPQQRSRDAVQEAQTSNPVPKTRPEQIESPHDRSSAFKSSEAEPSSPVFRTQPKEGKNSGFDFYRDPLNSDRPNQSPDEIMRELS